jgi:hypothetical protein
MHVLYTQFYSTLPLLLEKWHLLLSFEKGFLVFLFLLWLARMRLDFVVWDGTANVDCSITSGHYQSIKQASNQSLPTLQLAIPQWVLLTSSSQDISQAHSSSIIPRNAFPLPLFCCCFTPRTCLSLLLLSARCLTPIRCTPQNHPFCSGRLERTPRCMHASHTTIFMRKTKLCSSMYAAL